MAEAVIRVAVQAAVVGGEAAGRGEAKGHESSAVGMGRAGR